MARLTTCAQCDPPNISAVIGIGLSTQLHMDFWSWISLKLRALENDMLLARQEPHACFIMMSPLTVQLLLKRCVDIVLDLTILQDTRWV